MADNKKPPTRDVAMTLPITATNRKRCHLEFRCRRFWGRAPAPTAALR
jgi:hypothetical protein